MKPFERLASVFDAKKNNNSMLNATTSHIQLMLEWKVRWVCALVYTVDRVSGKAHAKSCSEEVL
jgi:hypothetical protein